MADPIPIQRYNVDSGTVLARGLVYSETQLDEVIKGPVRDLLLDRTGTAELNGMLKKMTTSDFGQERISQFLMVEQTFEDWRIGEALAEYFITDNNSCEFPWPTNRDLKNPDSSPTGADLTGFQKTNDEVNPFRFAFGEVKTSSDGNYPPNVMYGSEGLKNQLERLVDSDSTKWNLVKYLGHHAKNAPWQGMFESAATRFFDSDYSDIAIFGILIRDVLPNKSDLSSRANDIAKNCPEATSIFLYALYLPEGAISTLNTRLQVELQGGEQ